VAFAFAPASVLADAGHDHDAATLAAADNGADHEPMPPMMAMPMMSPERGMALFAEKGCVTCHAINGVGGHDATSLDAHDMQGDIRGMMNPFDFAAKMWLMAPYMIAAHEEAFGEQITFTGAELADIIAFVHDDAQQHEFSGDLLSARVMEMMNHEHGAAASGTEAHATEIGHKD
jgi:cytochrome c